MKIRSCELIEKIFHSQQELEEIFKRFWRFWKIHVWRWVRERNQWFFKFIL